VNARQRVSEPVIRNQQVVGSNPTGGSRKSNKISNLLQHPIRKIGQVYSVSPLCHHRARIRCSRILRHLKADLLQSKLILLKR
jgi:hypothetical protein